MAGLSNNDNNDARVTGLLERHLVAALNAAGWSLHHGDGPVAFWVAKGSRRYPLLFRHVREARRSAIQALLADAVLRGRACSRNPFAVVVGAPTISAAMARSIEQYIEEVAPDQPFGYVDERGLVRFHGLGLEAAQGEPSRLASQRAAAQNRPRDLFSDLNQWLLKVLAGRKLPAEMISVPREPVRSAAELSARADVSSPAAWRLYSALKATGHLDDSGNLFLIRDLLARWRAAAQRPQQRIGARWILPGRDPLGRLRASLSELRNEAEQPSACLGFFAACDALGVGHVRGVALHLYVRHVERELLNRLGIAIAPNGQPPDLLLRVPRWPESLFRAVVHVGGVPVADVIQCWLDVSGEPVRGAEQAAFIWRRVLGPAIASGEPAP
ncbi:MAG: hypothetical protein ABSB49_09295 [Polyangia bacterium]|jgi:hypothetical protein